MGLFQNLTGWHALILLAVVLLFFGAAKLPALARSLGQSAKIFKRESADPQRDTVAVDVAAAEAADVAAPTTAVDTVAVTPAAASARA